MPLTLQTQTVGSVVVIRCIGRIVAGDDAASLESEVRRHLAERTAVVLNLEQTPFMDSSGLGTIVRLYGAARHERLTLRLCGVTAPIQRILTLTNLLSVFTPHETEAQAIAAAKLPPPRTSSTAAPNRSIVCIHSSHDVVASIRECLAQAGFDVHSTVAIPDAMLLLKACRPDLLIASPATLSRLSERAHDLRIPVLEIPDEFSHADAGSALSDLLSRVRSILQRSASA